MKMFKRLMSLMLCLVMMLALVACGKAPAAVETKPAAEENAAVEEVACPNPGEPLRFASFGDTAGISIG